MEDWITAVCPDHGNVAWESDRPWNAFWCCQEADEAEAAEAAKGFAEAVFGW